MLRKICSNRWHKMLNIENEYGYWSTEADKARKRCLEFIGYMLNYTAENIYHINNG